MTGCSWPRLSITVPSRLCLKNALDWNSRPHTENEPSLWAYHGKVAALGPVAPGALSGLRGLVPLRMMLGNIGVTVVPNQVGVSNRLGAFDDAGALNNDQQSQMLTAMIDQLILTTRAMTGPV